MSRTLLLPTLLAGLLLVGNLLVGTQPFGMAELTTLLFHPTEADATLRFIVLDHRLPQALTALLAGAALAAGGLVMQSLFRNPLADPSLLGVNAGASLGAALALLLFGGTATIGMLHLSGYLFTLLAAFAGAGLLTLLLLAAARHLPGRGNLLVAGMMLSFLTSSAVALLHFFAAPDSVQLLLFWGMGDFSALGRARWPFFAIALIPALAGVILHLRALDAALLGDDYARSLGVDIVQARRRLLFLTGWLAAVVTASCGPVAFIGIAAPHLARLWLRTGLHRKLLPATLLTGANLTLFCLLIARCPIFPTTLPLNALTPLIGAPIVLGILLRR